MTETEDCFLKVRKDYLKFLSKEKIYGESLRAKIIRLKKFYIPLSFWINSKYKQHENALFLGFSGSQGSGKTTAERRPDKGNCCEN